MHRTVFQAHHSEREKESAREERERERDEVWGGGGKKEREREHTCMCTFACILLHARVMCIRNLRESAERTEAVFPADTGGVRLSV